MQYTAGGRVGPWVKSPDPSLVFGQGVYQAHGYGFPDIVGAGPEGQSQYASIQPSQRPAEPGQEFSSDSWRRRWLTSVTDRDRSSSMSPGKRQVFEGPYVLREARSPITGAGTDSGTGSPVHRQTIAYCVYECADLIAQRSHLVDEGNPLSEASGFRPTPD